jgi:Ser/Thr protein kinase RdoA (MazF antagonist)
VAESERVALPPPEVLDAAGVDAVDVRLLPWQVPIWKVRRGETVAVLRRTAVDALCSEPDIRWQHRLQLSCLARGLPVPRPLSAFGDESVLTYDGYVWELLTYLPGDTVGWRPFPSLREVGAMLARFHAAVDDLTAALGQRPSAVPLSELRSRVDLEVIDASLPNAEESRFRRYLDEVGARIAGLNALFGEGLIHGDLTTLNLLADGEPPTISGIIDFNNAYVESPLADLGSCLWQAGRPAHQRYVLDLRRVSGIVGGYCAVSPLPPSAGRYLVDVIAARGLQLMVRSSIRGPGDLRSPLGLVDWVVGHRAALEAVVV